jgi:hypothetical protein
VADGNAGNDDRLRARTAESRTKLWLYLETDRRLVVVAFRVVLAAGVVLPAAATKLRGVGKHTFSVPSACARRSRSRKCRGRTTSPVSL